MRIKENQHTKDYKVFQVLYALYFTRVFHIIYQTQGSHKTMPKQQVNSNYKNHMFNTTNIGQVIKSKTRQNSTRFFLKRNKPITKNHHPYIFEVGFNMQLFSKSQISNANTNHKKEGNHNILKAL
jgi:hypothetical protein